MTVAKPARRPYHHGDLRNALVQAGIELAGEGGPDAIVLREAARRVGVSATAAYRHFATLPELVDAVAARAMAGMGQAMAVEQERRTRSADPREDSWLGLCAVGRGYVRYAIAEPGLFTVAFGTAKSTDAPVPDPQASGPSPWEWLESALDAMVASGGLEPDRREAASTAAWAIVHGLSHLLIGKLADLPVAEKYAMIDRTLDVFGAGVVTS